MRDFLYAFWPLAVTMAATGLVVFWVAPAVYDRVNGKAQRNLEIGAILDPPRDYKGKHDV
jgi:hypothetical protein